MKNCLVHHRTSVEVYGEVEPCTTNFSETKSVSYKNECRCTKFGSTNLNNRAKKFFWSLHIGLTRHQRIDHWVFNKIHSYLILVCPQATWFVERKQTSSHHDRKRWNPLKRVYRAFGFGIGPDCRWPNHCVWVRNPRIGLVELEVEDVRHLKERQ